MVVSLAHCHGSSFKFDTLLLFLPFSLPQYFQDANEADAWMNDKAGIAANQDYGRDEDAAVKALKKHKVCATYVGYLFVVPIIVLWIYP